ncbi:MULTISPECIES: SDR family oxidoreductase [Epilithonimonas]|uniref:NADP-dependent 3-hydroxy acid dehydrogenase YdfG n=1 Tax=Epilithonimonas hominis TaxID=420404 RepID=A0A1H6L7U7_9FLAO|nr:SDR family oxidoreductase [Epilithonimonas hominis]SEH84542.1 NADP-dependent 3-hydroxy acid dehydrogenase YdfG [Epilithonimonas hominis]
MKPNDLNNKTVVITGASSGVGLAAAEAFAKEGCNLILAARGKEALENAVETCQNLGAIAVGIPTDVSDFKEVEHLAEEALKITGTVDFWVNNAGVMATGRYEETPIEVIDQVIKTNLLGYLHGARSILPIFKKQKHGILINNISIGGWMPAPYGTAYSASKYGIRGMTECLQGEVSDEPDIHICGLYPSIQKSTGNMHSAKYSGLDFKIPPTAADPKKLAEAMVEMAKNPQKSKFTDFSSLMMKGMYSLIPKPVINTTSAALRLLMKEDSETDTDGNVLTQSKNPMRIYGQTMLSPSKKSKNLILTGLGVAALVFLSRQLKPKA